MRDILSELLRGEQTKRGMLNPHKKTALRHSQKQLSQHCDQRRNHAIAKMQIRIALFIALSLCLLSGCQRSPQSYGNFAEAYSVELVRDAANALVANYPPAQTHLALAREADDTFGSALVETLRAHGYAVAEHTGRDKYLSAAKQPDGAVFAYVVDGGGDELRVTLHVGAESLSRMYRTRWSDDGPHYIPQGFWTRKQ